MCKRFVPALVAITVLACAFAASASAETLQPWWHLNSSARPTNLHYEQTGTSPTVPGKDEVQELVIGPSSTVEVKVGGNEVEVFETGPKYQHKKAFPEPTAANVQTALEAVYGADNVTVTEKAGANPGEVTLIVTSVGADAEKPLASPAEEMEVEPYNGTASVKVTTPGAAPKPGHPEPDGHIIATVINVGDANTAGEATIVDTLPKGLKAVGVQGELEVGSAHGALGKCELKEEVAGEAQSVVCLTGSNPVLPYDLVEVRVAVVVQPGAVSGEENEISVSGGGAPPLAIKRPLTISSAPTPFGVEDYELSPEESGGGVDTQAGSHPFQTTFTITQTEDAQTRNAYNGKLEVNPAGLARDIYDNFPPGLIGNPKAVDKCTDAQFLAATNECPASSVVGVAIVTLHEPDVLGLLTFTVPVFNLEPGAGEPAHFGFLPLSRETPVYIDAAVRTGDDYGITARVSDIPQTIGLAQSYVTIWGVPGRAEHDNTRGYPCLAATDEQTRYPPCQALQQNQPQPFFELPTQCTGAPLQSSVEADSWEEPGDFISHAVDTTGMPGSFFASEHIVTAFARTMPTIDGCDRLPFEPSLEVKPDAPDASSASGLTVNVKVPQEESLNAGGLGEADIQNTTVALPAGVSINPAGGEGLEACSNGLIGYLPALSTPPEDLHFTPRVPGGVDAKLAGEEAPLEPGINFCSNASKIGTAKITTPVLPHALEGAVYLAPQEANPFGSLIAMYIVVEDPESGVLLKLPGQVTLCGGAGEVVDGQTCQGAGQIVTTFLNTPQAPAENIELHFFGGERAPLATPSRCGAYTTTTSIVPWSGNGAVHPSATFDISSGPNGGPCPGAQLPFHPSATGGATNLQAGAFSPLTVSFSRSDGEQDIKSVVAKLPEGLSGILTGVELCPEPQANDGTCSENSKIGEATVSVGVGGHPYTVSGGRFYLTGPYNGTSGCTVGTSGCAPFGLTFEVPAKAGPFDLAHTAKNHPACDCVLVRGKIEINPLTSALTITSNPAGSPDSIPTMLEGIPLEIQHINATTTRGNFQFNPTNCNKMELIGELALNEGGTSTISNPFQVTNCAALKFEPKFSVSTSGKTSKSKGASLTAKVTYPNVPQGTDADIAKVKVELPKQLPSRLTTLQKACTDKQFELNPANCPKESKIGYAVVHTPLIPVPLEGPAIFVSHGGEAFPSLTMVLQGYGITIDLVGTTFISKAGITSTTFKTVPDQPFSSFQLTLPEGKYSALAANGNLCTEASKLIMPTEFVSQAGGAPIKESTKIGVSGCAKVRTRAQKLAAALAVCRKQDKKNKGKREKCEAAAKKKYGAVKKKKKASKGHK